jgi:flagellar basal body rod protein FlgG
MTPGKIRHTDRSLDLAIEGEGFFQLEDRRTQQVFYTRSGRFAVNAKGELVWRTLLRELQLRPAVRFAATENEIEISSDGTIRAPGANGTAAGPSTAGSPQNHAQHIHIVRLPVTADLVPTGENLFVVRGDILPGSEQAAGPAFSNGALSARLRQNCLEESNVDVDRELRDLERLRRQGHALEMAGQSLPFGLQESLNPSNGPTTIPSHIAGTLGQDRH